MTENKTADTENKAADTENKAAENKGRKVSGKKDPYKKVKIKLPKTRELRDDVFISVNNYTCIIKRGEEVEVPLFVKEVLDRQEEMRAKRMDFEEEHQK